MEEVTKEEEITKEEKENRVKQLELMNAYCVSQLIHISKYGCSKIKCKKCVLNRVCDKFSEKSKDLAQKMIAYAKICKN